MNYIDYPLAKTWQEATDHVRSGGEVWTPLLDNFGPEDVPGVTCWQVESDEELLELSEGEDSHDAPDIDLHLVK